MAVLSCHRSVGIPGVFLLFFFYSLRCFPAAVRGTLNLFWRGLWVCLCEFRVGGGEKKKSLLQIDFVKSDLCTSARTRRKWWIVWGSRVGSQGQGRSVVTPLINNPVKEFSCLIWSASKFPSRLLHLLLHFFSLASIFLLKLWQTSRTATHSPTALLVFI